MYYTHYTQSLFNRDLYDISKTTRKTTLMIALIVIQISKIFNKFISYL